MTSSTPLFFTTSAVGGAGPDIGRPTGRLRDANDIAELAKNEILLTCQGGDYTKAVYPKLRAAGWDGYWIDAASARRQEKDAVIILDPVNRRRRDFSSIGVCPPSFAASLPPRGRRPTRPLP